METIDPRDQITLAHAPLAAMPRYANFEALDGPAPRHRFIAAADGLWLELSNPWLYLMWPIADSAMPLPYGEVLGDEIQYAWPDEELQEFIERFVINARKVLPNECAAWGVWDTKTLKLEYRPLIATEAGPGGITFHRPALAEHEHLAIDIHSHGTLGAFFSGTDDADDDGAVKLSIVVGCLDTAEPTRAMRLCALGLTIDYEADEADAGELDAA